MIDWINYIAALCLSTVAGIIDLKTTEIPEEIPYLMTAIGVFLWSIKSMMLSSPYPLLLSLISGAAMYAIGYFLYHHGAWGEGDAAIFGSMGAMLPVLNGLFYPPVFVFSLLAAGGIYTLIYSIVLVSRKPDIWLEFLKRFNRHRAYAVLLPPLALVVFGNFHPSLGLVSSISILFAIVAWSFGKTVEDEVFVREIDASEIREGDVLADSSKIVGITREEAERIRKRGGKVKIKEGIRFGLSFPLSLIFSLMIV